MATAEPTREKPNAHPGPGTLVREPRWQSLARSALVPVLAVFTALVLGAFIIALSGGDPFLAYVGLWQGAVGSPQALSETAVWSVPYIFAGLGVALAFKGGLFNIGADGQLVVGAVVSAWVGFALPGILVETFPPSCTFLWR